MNDQNNHNVTPDEGFPSVNVMAFDGMLLEVDGLPGVSFKPSENVKIDLRTRQIRS